jgi:hypothetical protein
MKKLLGCLIAVTSFLSIAAHAESISGDECIKRISAFVGGSDINLKGKSADGECALSFLFSEDSDRLLGRLSGFQRVENIVVPGSVSLEVGRSDQFSTYTVNSCSQQGQSFVLDIRQDDKTGWKKKHRYQAKFVSTDDGALSSVWVEESQMGDFANSGFDVRMQCSF